MLIYLASPYTHEDAAVMRSRFETVCERAAYLMRRGLHIYSPIAHSHPIAQYGLPKDWKFWEEYDRKILAVCGELYVLTIDGWFQSKGVSAEINIALELLLPVKYVSLGGEITDKPQPLTIPINLKRTNGDSK